MEQEIKGFENYIVNDEGEVFTKNDRGRWGRKKMKQKVTKLGYAEIGLYSLGRQKYKLIHRLVAEAFIPNPENKPEVNHIDGNKLNNAKNNLEWTTRKENQKHAYLLGLQIPRSGEAHHYFGKAIYENRKEILQYTKEGEFIREWKGVTIAADYMGVPKGNISQCLVNNSKSIKMEYSSGGYIWRYKNLSITTSNIGE